MLATSVWSVWHGSRGVLNRNVVLRRQWKEETVVPWSRRGLQGLNSQQNKGFSNFPTHSLQQVVDMMQFSFTWNLNSFSFFGKFITPVSVMLPARVIHDCAVVVLPPNCLPVLITTLYVMAEKGKQKTISKGATSQLAHLQELSHPSWSISIFFALGHPCYFFFFEVAFDFSHKIFLQIETLLLSASGNGGVFAYGFWRQTWKG